MKKIGMCIMGLAVVFLAASSVYAQPQGMGEGRHEGIKEEMYKELNLTPEQQKKLEANREAQRQEREKLFAALRDGQAKLRDAMKNPAVTRAAVEPLANNLKAIQGQLIDHRIDGFFAVKGILTPEQFTKFQEMAEKRMGETRSGFGKFHEKQKSVSQGQETK